MPSSRVYTFISVTLLDISGVCTISFMPPLHRLALSFQRSPALDHFWVMAAEAGRRNLHHLSAESVRLYLESLPLYPAHCELCEDPVYLFLKLLRVFLHDCCLIPLLRILIRRTRTLTYRRPQVTPRNSSVSRPSCWSFRIHFPDDQSASNNTTWRQSIRHQSGSLNRLRLRSRIRQRKR